MKEELSTKTRTESDLIGSREIPESAMYGVQTLRGIENFRISKFHLNEYPLFINALAITKMGAAIANSELGLLTGQQTDAILKACKEILEGKHHEQFPVDMIQGGAGTTTNMIANRALEIMGHKRGEYQYCSPNDHVNRSQSTNDAYPTAIHIGMYYTHLKLVKHFEELINAFQRKAEAFKHIIKMGRTQLEDAVPMTLGQTFNGFASILRNEIKNLNFAAEEFLTVNMGATAIGTGIAAEPEYAEKCVKALSKLTGWDVKLSGDLVGATSDTSCLVGYSSAMRRVAVKMNKICNDLRLLASGPRCGLGEINLPAMQPGSSIMPGKVNPVIPEVMNQIDYKVTVTRETTKDSDDEDAEETTTVTYKLDDADLDETTFTTFYNKLINMTAQQRLTEDYTPEDDPAYTFVFKDTDGNEITAEYYEYDTNFYAAVVGDKVYLVNKMNVRDMDEAYQDVMGKDKETASEE